jgi:formamidopyrimidine-DNA glycosylase
MIISLCFEDGTAFSMSDYQGAATPKLNPEPRETPDAADITAAYLEEQTAASRATIKNLLLNQDIILGIGNAYADEILWDAGIHPLSVSNKIPGAKIKTLAKSIKKVLKDAVKQILKSQPDIISGEVRDFMAVHHAHRKQSPTGGTIKTATAGGRKTYFTDEQELYK